MNSNVINNLSLALQLLNLQLLFDDCNNTDLMQALQNQNSNYLEKIIKQNDEILQYLRKGGIADGKDIGRD